ncbi:hypothetical protein AB7942_18680 [Neobacillus sp. BF23-41]
MLTLREEALKMDKENQGKLDVHSKVPVRNAKYILKILICFVFLRMIM